MSELQSRSEWIQIVGQITEIEIIAVGNSIREVERLRKLYGTGRWRKLKGIATAVLTDDTICNVEIHWIGMKHTALDEKKSS